MLSVGNPINSEARTEEIERLQATLRNLLRYQQNLMARGLLAEVDLAALSKLY